MVSSSSVSQRRITSPSRSMSMTSSAMVTARLRRSADVSWIAVSESEESGEVKV